MYRKVPPTDGANPFLQALAKANQSAEVEVWPENWPILRVFSRLRTQWRTGMAGPTGLAYEAVYPLLDRLAPRDSAEWDELLDDIRAMELEALSAMQED